MTFKAVLILILSLNLASCDSFNSFWSKAKEKLENGQKEIFFNELTDYDWDLVCVLPPYTVGISKRQGVVENLLPEGIKFDANKLPERDSDGAWVFAFIKNHELIRFEERGRGPGLKADYQKNCIANSNARFVKGGTAPLGTEYLLITDKDGE